jgi:ankyrin repeat protein
MLKGHFNRPTYVVMHEQRTSLHKAASAGHTAVVQLLLGAHAAVDTPGAHGSTALHKAAWSGHTAVVRLLLHDQAAVDAVDAKGCTALHVAASLGHSAVVQLLLNAHAAVMLLLQTPACPCIGQPPAVTQQ